MNAWKTGFRKYRGNSVVRYGFTNLLPRGVAILGTLLLTPLALDRLGVVSYGIWVLATLIPTVISSPDFGITSGVVNEVAKLHQRQGHVQTARSQLLGLARLLKWIAVGWLGIGTLVLTCYVFIGSGVRPGVNSTALFTALLLALAVFTLGIPNSLWARVQLAQERGHEFLVWEGLGKVVSFFGSLAVLWFVPNLLLLVLMTLLPNVVTAYLNARIFIRKSFGTTPMPGHIPPLREVLRENRAVLHAGRYFVIFQVAYLIGTALDPFLVNRFLGTQQVTYLSVVKRPFDALPLVVTLFSTALWPVFNRLNATDRVPELRGLLLKLTGVTLVGLGALNLLIIGFAGPIYSYLGQGQVLPERQDLIWLSLRVAAVTLVILLNNYLNAVALLRMQAWVQISSALVLITLTVLSLKYADIHTYLAVSTSAYLLTSLVPITWLTFAHLRRRQAKSTPAS